MIAPEQHFTVGKEAHLSVSVELVAACLRWFLGFNSGTTALVWVASGN